MAVHIPRLSISRQIIALIILITLGGNWSPGSTVIVQRSVSYQALSGLPPEALVAITRLLDHADNDSAHPLVIDQWTEQGKFTASDGAEGYVFGSAVAISGDTIVVGAAGDDAEQGSAYVFVKPNTGWADLTETAKLTATDGAALDWIGYSVALEGDTIVVGAPGGPTGPSTVPGAAYIYVKPAGGWADMTQTAKLTASDAAIDDRFGISVAISGDTVIVGAGLRGAAYVFVKPGAGWVDMSETARLTASDGAAGDFFGWSVALSGDTVVVGAYGDAVGMNDNQGSAYVFVKPGAGWVDTTETAKLIASDGVAGDALGYSVAIDGDTLVAGANNDAIVGEDNRGSVYVFVRPGGGWMNTVQTAKLTPSDGAAHDWFGRSVALSEETVVAGAFANAVGANVAQGSAYVFDKPSGGWVEMNETIKLIASDGEAQDAFGWSVAMDGDTLAAGAYSDSIGANINQGSAYVFYYDTRLRIYFPLIGR